MHKFVRQLVLLSGAATLGGVAVADVLEVAIPGPDADRWMYPHNFSAGNRVTASVFSALPSPQSETGSDDRFAQFVIRFDTAAAGIPKGLGSNGYALQKLTFRAVVAISGDITYDPTPDPLESFGPDAMEDPDSGRPVELHGTGFRNGHTAMTYQETSPFGVAGVRSAYALGYDESGVARDVSNNVTQGFDSRPWATARFEVWDENDERYVELSPGDLVPQYAVARFDVDLRHPDVASYLGEALHSGKVWFTLSSLHSAMEIGASEGFPSFFTKDYSGTIPGFFSAVAPSLEISVDVSPRIEVFEVNPTTRAAHLQWHAAPGFEYVIQRSTNLAVDAWEDAATLSSPVEALLTWDGPADPEPKRFFRIKRVEGN